MTGKRISGVLVALLLVLYCVACVRGWLGASYERVVAPDSDYNASIFSHAPLLLPFVRTFQVLVPSQGDLNSHVVFQKTSLRKTFSLRWQSPTRLQIVCGNCDGTELRQKQVDNIVTEVVRQ